MNRARFGLPMALALVAGACAGPQAPIDVGSKEVPIDLLLGAKVVKVAQAPLPPLEIPVTPQGLITFRPTPPPLPGATTTTTEPPGPCPEADPLDVPKKVATNTVTELPKAGSYQARTVGRMRVGGANAQDVLLNPTSTIEVAKPRSEVGGNLLFDHIVRNGNAETTTTYRIVPLGVSPPNPPGAPVTPPATVPSDAPKPSPAAPGLYVAGVSSPGSLGFTPTTPGILITRFPIDLGTAIDTSGSDGTTTTSWRTTVKAKETVDACGTPIDTYRIELSNGRTVTGNSAESVTFTGVVNLGTQYGGLPLYQRTDASGSQGTTQITRSVQLTYNSEPNA